MLLSQRKRMLAVLGTVRACSTGLGLVWAEQPAAPPRTDRHGDPLPAGALARLGSVRLRHPGVDVKSLAFMPDGKSLLALSYGGLIRRWDVKTGREMPPMVGGDEGIDQMALSRDGKTLAFCLAYGAFHGDYFGRKDVHLWDTTQGKSLRVIEEEGGYRQYLSAIALSPDGRRVAAAGKEDEVIPLYDTATGKKLRQLKGPKDNHWQLAFSPDGKLLASTGGLNEKAVRCWDVESGKQRQLATGSFTCLLFLPDGTLVVGGEGVLFLNPATGKEVLRLQGLHQTIKSLAVSPDGKVLACGERGPITESGPCELTLWETATGKRIRSLPPHPDEIKALAFSPDGRLLASTTAQRIHLWDTAGGKEVLPLDGHARPVTALAWSPDGKQLATGAEWESTVRLWDPASGKELRQLAGIRRNADCLAYAPDGKTLAAVDYDYLFLWDAATGKRRHCGPNEKVGEGRACCFLPDGKKLVTADGSARVTGWETATGKHLHQFQPHLSAASADASPLVGACAFSPDGRILAAALDAGEDNAISLWDTRTGRRIRAFAPGLRHSAYLAFSPDGRLLASRSGSGTIHLWETASGQERGRLAESGSDSPRDGPFSCCLALSPDGRYLAASDRWNGALFDLATGKKVRNLGVVHNPPDIIRCLAFSPDGKRLAAGYQHTYALIWDMSDLPTAPPRPDSKPSAAQLAQGWAQLAGQDAARAGRAIWLLAGSGNDAVALLKEKLRPAVAPRPERVAGLIADLDSSSFEAREKATRALEQLGDLAEPALRQALADSPSLESRRRLNKLLAAVPPPPLHVVRGLEVLERMNSRAARQLLEALAAGAPAARQTQQARAALERLARQPVAPP